MVTLFLDHLCCSTPRDAPGEGVSKFPTLQGQLCWKSKAQIMTGTSSKFKAIEPQVWTKPFLIPFLRYPTNMYVPSEISTPNKCLPRLSQGQIFCRYFSQAQRTSIPHYIWDLASKDLCWRPIVVPWGKCNVRALSITTRPTTSHPPQRGPTGQLRSPPAWPEVWHGMLKWMFMEQKAPFLCPLRLRVPLVWCVCKQTSLCKEAVSC